MLYETNFLPMKNILLFLALILNSCTNSQNNKPFRENIETDSSNIEITRNSVYRVYEETYKYKDSIWWNVTFINDTTILNTEGWKNKKGKHFGIWKEYDINKNLLYTRNYDKQTCIVNKKIFPYHDILEKMKITADNLIIKEYGKEFFKAHVFFEFDATARYAYKTKIGEDSMWTEDYVGTWIEPMSKKPNSFLFRYEVKLNRNDEEFVELGICLDSTGKYFSSSDDNYSNYGFEKTSIKYKSFNIQRTQALKIAKENGLTIDSTKVFDFLNWENYRKQQFYNGAFIYNIVELIKEENYIAGKGRQGKIFRYLVYKFNPWNGKFLEIVKMKSTQEWEKKVEVQVD